MEHMKNANISFFYSFFDPMTFFVIAKLFPAGFIIHNLPSIVSFYRKQFILFDWPFDFDQ